MKAVQRILRALRLVREPSLTGAQIVNEALKNLDDKAVLAMNAGLRNVANDPDFIRQQYEAARQWTPPEPDPYVWRSTEEFDRKPVRPMFVGLPTSGPHWSVPMPGQTCSAPLAFLGFDPPIW